MQEECNYGFGRSFAEEHPVVLGRVERELEGRGFRIYSRIDLQKVLADGDKGAAPYLILGACRADFAFQAFSADPNIGMLLPCNVVVYSREDGSTVVMVKDPARIMDLVREPRAIEAAMKVKEALEEMVEAL